MAPSGAISLKDCMATGKPRIFELAKELGMSSKDLLGLFGRLGLEAKNQLSVVEPKVADLLRAQLKGAKPASKPAPAAAPAAPAAIPATPVAAQADAPVAATPAPRAKKAAAPAAAPPPAEVQAVAAVVEPAAPPVAPAASAPAEVRPAAERPEPPEPSAPVPQLRPVTTTKRQKPAAAQPQAPAAEALEAPEAGPTAPPPARRATLPSAPVPAPTLQPVPAGQASIRPPRAPARPMNQPSGNGQIPGRPGPISASPASRGRRARRPRRSRRTASGRQRRVPRHPRGHCGPAPVRRSAPRRRGRQRPALARLRPDALVRRRRWPSRRRPRPFHPRAARGEEGSRCGDAAREAAPPQRRLRRPRRGSVEEARVDRDPRHSHRARARDLDDRSGSRRHQRAVPHGHDGDDQPEHLGRSGDRGRLIGRDVLV